MVARGYLRYAALLALVRPSWVAPTSRHDLWRAIPAGYATLLALGRPPWFAPTSRRLLFPVGIHVLEANAHFGVTIWVTSLPPTRQPAPLRTHTRPGFGTPIPFRDEFA